MKNILLITFLLTVTFSSFGQDDCKICKIVHERDSLIKVIAKMRKSIGSLIRSNDDKSKLIKKLELELQTSNIKIKELNTKGTNYDEKIQKLKKDSVSLRETLAVYQNMLEKEKQEKEDLELINRNLQVRINDLESKSSKFWKENIPLNADSTFVVPYGENGIKISYIKSSRKDYRLNTDNYSERFLNHLKSFLRNVQRNNITLIIKIYGRRRDETDIVIGIERVLNPYLENYPYSHIFEPGESFVTFSFEQELSGKIGGSK